MLKNEITLVESKKEGGKVYFSGSHSINGVLFNYSMSEQYNNSYKMRGTVRMLDDQGRLFRIQKENGKPANPKDIYTNEVSFEKAKEVIYQGMTELYNAYGITANINNQQDVSNCSFGQAVSLHGYKFLCSKNEKVVESTFNKKLNMLKNFALKFGATSIHKISLTTIRNVCLSLNSKNYSQLLRLSRDFYNFCQFRGLYCGRNRFDEYLENYSVKNRKSPEALCRAATTIRSLDTVQTEKLHKEIASAHPLDPRYTSLLLCSCEGLHPKTICSLNWNDIVFDLIAANSAQVIYSLNFAGSAVINYTKPCTPFAAFELKRRSEAIQAKFGTLDVPVTTRADRTLLQEPQIKQFFKDRLRYILNISDNEINSFANGNETSGAVRLLQNHYKFTLINYCKLKDDPSTLAYLCGRSIHESTTNSNYRSFIDEEGQNFLYNLLMRIPFDNPSEVHGIRFLSTFNKTDMIEYSSPEIDRLTHVEGITVILAPGESLSLTSNTKFSIDVQTKLGYSSNPILEEDECEDQISIFDTITPDSLSA